MTEPKMVPTRPAPLSAMIGMFATNEGDAEMLREFVAAIEAEARQQERERIAAAVKAFIASAEPDIAYEGEGFVDYVVPFDAMEALKAAITGEEQGRG